MNILEWTKKDKPAGVPVMIYRDFIWAELKEHGDDFPKRAEQFMLATAKLYAEGREFRFLPIPDLTKEITACFTFESNGGEIAIFLEQDKLDVKVTVGIIMEILNG